MRMSALLLCGLFLLVALPLVQAAPINGVKICTVPYACHDGETDGVCPSNYQTGSTCALCDNDCGSCPENNPTLCSDAVDNDIDTNKNYADVNPGYAPGQSCNVCDVGTCTAIATAAARSSPPAAPAGANPVGSNGYPALSPGKGLQYIEGTLARPGDGTNLRLDVDGTGGASSCWCPVCPAGTAWDSTTNTCPATPPWCAAQPAPVINSFTATPASGSAPLGVTLTLQGSAAIQTLEIDTNGDTSVYEQSSSSSPFSVALSLPVGTHTFYARIRDCSGRSATSSVTVVVNNNVPPIIHNFNETVTPKWASCDASIFTNVSDNTANIVITADYGDGVTYNTNSGPATKWSANLLHTYAPGVYTARLTVTDSAAPALNTTTTRTITCTTLACVQGTQTGNATYDNNAAQCCSNSCSNSPSGWANCYEVSSCSPTNATICSGPIVPPTFVDRDTSQLHCEAASVSCTAFTWATADNPGLCCGDDANEYVATVVAGAVGAACCAQPNQCYTAFGDAPGCYDGREDNPATCTDGMDNDCDGVVDIGDSDCAPALIDGYVTYVDPLDRIAKPLAGANVTVGYTTITKTTDSSGYYKFNSTNLVGAPLGDVTVYAYKLGYTTGEEAADLAPGNTNRIDFELAPRRCNADCTNDQGFCDSSCIGVGDCQPTPVEEQTLYACHPPGATFGLRKGTEVILGVDEENQELLVGVCCTVPGLTRSAPAATVIDAGQQNTDMRRIDTLVKYTRLITLNGKTYKLVINTW
jgi:hypothetical protein